jgi:cytochrome P450
MLTLEGIFTVDHERWQEARQLIRPQFIKDRVSDLETFEKHVCILLEQIPAKGQDVDIKDLFFRYQPQIRSTMHTQSAQVYSRRNH